MPPTRALTMANNGNRRRGEKSSSSENRSQSRRTGGSSSGAAGRASGAAGRSSRTGGDSTDRCRHYKRMCNMVAPCCDSIVCCEIGHDSAGRCRTKLDGNLHWVRFLVCCECNQRQPIGNCCRVCKRSFGDYGCPRCRKWDNKEAFHCDYCGVCRKGNKKNTMHCEVCNKCYPLSLGGASHKCSTDSKCVGCQKDTQRSKQESSTMACGHVMHKGCFLQRVQKNFNCPVKSCRKSVGNMKRWNKELAKLAEKQRKENPIVIANIICNDCRVSSKVRSGGNLNQCKNCGSFNTARRQ